MANRFAGPIRRGEIGSIEELKSRFKALAKETHPDLGAAGASAVDFSALRSEYEAALADFHRHRFGLSSSRENREAARGQSSSMTDEVGGNPARASMSFSRPELYRRLRELRRGGFPKLPRHEKERFRYEYRRYLAMALLEARGEAWRERFEAFETAHLGGTDPGFPPGILDLSLGLLDSILAWHASGLDHERTGIIWEFGRLALDLDGGGEGQPGGREARRLGEGLEGHPLFGFLTLLVGDLATGAALSPL